MSMDFIFDGQHLSEFGYMICDFNSNTGTTTTTMSDLTFTEIKSATSDTSHKVASSHNDNLSKTIQICKNMCNKNYEDIYITTDEMSEIAQWLCRKDYKWFAWNTTDDVYYQAKINLKKIELYEKCIGFELDIITNRPYAVTEEKTIKWTFHSDELNKPRLLNVYSDEEGFIYPDMVITIAKDGDLEIYNDFEPRSTVIRGCKLGEIITIIGKDSQQILSNDDSHNMSTSYNYIFPRLCSLYHNSINKISVNLECDIEIKYRGVRKVGI